MEIFRAYDVRGVYEKDLTPQIAQRIACTFANLFGLKNAAIAHDVRLSSPALSEAVIKGLTSQGCHVVNIGLVPTPTLFWYVINQNLDGGVMISASHSPPEWNGLKFCLKGAVEISWETGIKQLKELYEREYPSKPGAKVTKKDVSSKYVNFLLSKVKFPKALKVVIDAANGCCSLLAPHVFERIGCEVEKLFCEYDGRFPGHLPEPTHETLTCLKEKVVESGADLGIAYDGDGDRTAFVDEKGNFVEGDAVLALFVQALVKSGEKVLFDVRCSQALIDVINAVGAKPVECRSGRVYVKPKAQEMKARVGGELTGHFVFPEIGYVDDGIYASLKLAELLARSGKTLSELVAELPRYTSMPEQRIPCKNKFQVVGAVKEAFKDYRLSTVDGVKIYFKNGWALVRASHTEEKISLRFEAVSEESLRRIRNRVWAEIERCIKK